MNARCPQRRTYLAGALSGLAAVSIWASWMAITRLSVTGSLGPDDITALRFGVAALIVLPIVLRRGIGLDRLSAGRLLVLVSGAGAPYALVAASGLQFAPAAHAGVLIPGVMPLFVAGLACVVFRERFGPTRLVGLGLMICGLLAIVAPTLAAGFGARSLGHGLFLCAAFMWACYTLVLRNSGLEPLHAAAIVAVGSAVGYLPAYLATGGELLSAPAGEVLAQALYQGVLATILSLYFFGRAVALLGASAGASFGALVPGLAALFAAVLLGEMPRASDLAAIAATSIGVYFASGGPLPLRNRSAPAVESGS